LVWSATPLDETGVGTPGVVLRRVPGQGVVVQAGQSVVLLRRVQAEGSSLCRADELLTAGDELSTAIAGRAA
jgi:methionyl-tRNA formyltransferase